MTSLVSLVLWLTPLLPEQIPANTIYMGEHLEPIVAERSKCKSLTGYCMTLTLRNYLQVKDAVQNQPALCTIAVNKTAEACRMQAEALADLVAQRDLKDAELIKGYQVKLKALDHDLVKTQGERLRWKWAAISVSSLSAILTATIIIIRK